MLLISDIASLVAALSLKLLSMALGFLVHTLGAWHYIPYCWKSVRTWSPKIKHVYVILKVQFCNLVDSVWKPALSLSFHACIQSTGWRKIHTPCVIKLRLSSVSHRGCHFMLNLNIDTMIGLNFQIYWSSNICIFLPWLFLTFRLIIACPPPFSVTTFECRTKHKPTLERRKTNLKRPPKLKSHVAALSSVLPCKKMKHIVHPSFVTFFVQPSFFMQHKDQRHRRFLLFDTIKKDDIKELDPPLPDIPGIYQTSQA